jgi:transcriptional regulator GlxA family with amidase domain
MISIALIHYIYFLSKVWRLKTEEPWRKRQTYPLIATTWCDTFDNMKHLSILALEDATLNSIDSCYQILNRVNDFLKYQKKEPYYKVDIVGAASPARINKGLYSINVHATLNNAPKTDVIFVPIICGDFSATAKVNAPYRAWIMEQYNQGAEIVSLCVGSFLVASTGLLDNKRCSIHWAAKNEFQSTYPNVNLIDESIITDENGIYTCGGGYSFLNLILYVIEKHLGHEMAVLASKMFQIDIDRKTQNPFVIFMGQKRHDDPTILEAQDLIESHPNLWITVEMICERVGMSRRTFERRFRKCTGNSVTEYIQRVKIEHAKKELEITSKTINEIIFNTGYNDVDAFRKVFKKFTDLSPLEYRRRYSSSASQSKKVV